MLHSTVKGWKLFSKIRNKTKVPTLNIPIQHSTGSSSQSNLANKTKQNKTKQTKKHAIGNEAVKFSVLANAILSSIGNPKDSIQNC